MQKNKSDKPTHTVSKTPSSSQTAQQGVDSLLESLAFLTAHFGRARSAPSIKAGLAYDAKGMGPRLFVEAAERLGLKARIVKRPDFTRIAPGVMPVVLITKDSRAVVLLKQDEGKKTVTYYDPSSGKTEHRPIDTLQNKYAGHAIYVQPTAAFTEPDSPAAGGLSNHWFWGVVLQGRGLYGRVLLAALFINIFGLVSPIFIMNVYDRVIPNNAIETGWVLAIGALTVFVFDFIMRTLRAYFIDLAGRRIDVVVTRRIYDHLLDMKLSGKPQSGGVFANIVREFDSVRDFMTSATVVGLVDLPFTLFFLAVLYLIGGPIALMLGCLILIVIGVGLLLQWPLRLLVGQGLHKAEARHGLLVETIGGLETAKAIGADGYLRARYGTHVGEGAAISQKSRFWSGLGVNAATFLQQSATIMIVLIGMYLVKDSVLTIGGLIACVILGGRAIAPIGQVANLLARFHQSRMSLDSLERLMAAPSERPAHKPFLHRPDLKGKLAMDKVSFAYPGTDRQVLNDVSFTIEPGEKVGLIGRIGSGKSTVARLFLGLYDPDSGVIAADDTDYRQIDPADLRRNMAYIAQDVVLFRGSVRENITIAHPQATENEILEAAKEAGVHDFVSRHPMGYDAPVGERGEGLSGGQRQAIALARALLTKPKIIIADEPTNAMDVQAETAFTHLIGHQVQNRTLVLITHRHHLLKLVDRLILMDQGRVVLDGPRDKVIEALNKGQVEVPQKADAKPEGAA